MNPRDAAKAWLRQAQSDLVHARLSMEAGHADWACLAAHHAAEKALKGLALDGGHRPLATNNPALLAADLVEMGLLTDAQVAALGDLETLESIALRVRDPDRAIRPDASRDAADLARAAVARTERLLTLVAEVARGKGPEPNPPNGAMRLRSPDPSRPAAR